MEASATPPAPGPLNPVLAEVFEREPIRWLATPAEPLFYKAAAIGTWVSDAGNWDYGVLTGYRTSARLTWECGGRSQTEHMPIVAAAIGAILGERLLAVETPPTRVREQPLRWQAILLTFIDRGDDVIAGPALFAWDNRRAGAFLASGHPLAAQLTELLMASVQPRDARTARLAHEQLSWEDRQTIAAGAVAQCMATRASGGANAPDEPMGHWLYWDTADAAHADGPDDLWRALQRATRDAVAEEVAGHGVHSARSRYQMLALDEAAIADAAADTPERASDIVDAGARLTELWKVLEPDEQRLLAAMLDQSKKSAAPNLAAAARALGVDYPTAKAVWKRLQRKAGKLLPQ